MDELKEMIKETVELCNVTTKLCAVTAQLCNTNAQHQKEILELMQQSERRNIKMSEVYEKVSNALDVLGKENMMEMEKFDSYVSKLVKDRDQIRAEYKDLVNNYETSRKRDNEILKAIISHLHSGTTINNG